jgi:hypothetical protein
MATTMHGAILDASYNIPAATAAALNTAIGELNTANNDYTNAHAAAKAATAARHKSHSDLVAQIAAIAKTLYNDPAVDDEMIAAAGLAIHDTAPTPQTPTQPLNLVATPNWDGAVELKWARNANPALTSFLVEASADGTNWDVVHTTTKSRATVTGYTPGVNYWFRIRASKNEITTLPSNVAEIYPSGSQNVNLELAA